MSGPGLANVSISFTSAVVYAVSGLIFLLLIFLLVLMGVSNCDCHCSRSELHENVLKGFETKKAKAKGIYPLKAPIKFESQFVQI